ncbi:hypothetical protein ACGK9R_01610 [Halomonas sp. HNIBRBA4712]|uniref:hypothetical protein n=1 Tax=Halomonas sp. HNIBRBA4712 TaxID=3373087 RepID=UPI003745884A
MSRIALVTFAAGTHRYALEASQVQSQRLRPDAKRHVSAAEWLGLPGEHPAPERWLTIDDHRGLWQLGVAGDVELIERPTASLYPLPELVRASAHPALCGLALKDQRVALWLLDARRAQD